MEGLTLEATKVVLHAVNMVFKCTSSSSSSGGGEGVKGWAEALDQSQVFVRLLEGVGKPVSFYALSSSMGWRRGS